MGQFQEPKGQRGLSETQELRQEVSSRKQGTAGAKALRKDETQERGWCEALSREAAEARPLWIL